jgi:very-short-patch-repair endonuclease
MKPKAILYQQARKFRKQPTQSEDRLWRALKNNPHNYKFRRQHPLGRFIVDIYHAASHLIIEIDGSAHEDSQARDQERTGILESAGYRVIRFSNDDIDQRLDLVLERIYTSCAEPSQNEKAP